MRLKAYAAMKAEKEGNFGLMYPSETKKKNKVELQTRGSFV